MPERSPRQALVCGSTKASLAQGTQSSNGSPRRSRKCSEYVVAVVSENSVKSRWCSKELSLALTEGLGREGVKLLPLRLGNVKMPATLADVYYLQVDPLEPAAVAARDFCGTFGLIEKDPSPSPSPNARRREEGHAYRAGHTSAGYRCTKRGRLERCYRDRLWQRDRASRLRRAGVTPADYARRGLAPGKSDRTPGPIADRGDVKLVGIVHEGVGRPRNDGTRGSALYAVPFRLSRTPTRLME